jgi:hypothetical protein
MLHKIVRTVVAVALLFEAGAFILGAMLHLGVPVPLPYVETRSLRFALVEAASGGLLVIAFGAALLHKRIAWKLAVGANVAGVASIAYVTARGSASAQSSHHQAMLILLILVLVGLSIPRCRHALENGRHVRRRRRVLQSL